MSKSFYKIKPMSSLKKNLKLSDHDNLKKAQLTITSRILLPYFFCKLITDIKNAALLKLY